MRDEQPNAFEAAVELAERAEAAGQAVQQLSEAERDAAYEKAEKLGLVGKRPIREAEDDFSKWLRMQTVRHDRIGALARVATRDPTWPSKGFAHRSALIHHFRSMGARDFVVQTAGLAWDDYEKTKRRTANKAKRQQQKQSRKVNRRARRK